MDCLQRANVRLCKFIIILLGGYVNQSELKSVEKAVVHTDMWQIFSWSVGLWTDPDDQSPTVNSSGWLLWLLVCGEQCVSSCILSNEHHIGELQHQHSSVTERIHHPGQPLEQWSCWSTCTDRHPVHMRAYVTCRLVYKPPPTFSPKAAVINPAIWELASLNACNTTCCSASHHLY